MTARNNILQRLHASSRAVSADFFAPPASSPDVSAYYARHRGDETVTARLARFRAAIAAAHAEVHDTSVSAWPQALANIAAGKKLQTLLVGNGMDGRQLAAAPPGDLKIVSYDRPVDDWRNELFTGIASGLSRARCAIAATGSLVLWTGAEEPRLLSLVPPVHFVLIDAVAIHADLHQAMTAEGWAGKLPTNALLISGPSKTADIQQTLAYGAHGPRELIVLVVHPAGAQP